jgi:hypothetical protein
LWNTAPAAREGKPVRRIDNTPAGTGGVDHLVDHDYSASRKPRIK